MRTEGRARHITVSMKGMWDGVQEGKKWKEGHERIGRGTRERVVGRANRKRSGRGGRRVGEGGGDAKEEGQEWEVKRGERKRRR